MMTFTEKTIEIISKIPNGKIITYGAIAILAGNPKASRQVSWTLRTYSRKHNLPWHRVINSKGMISLPPGDGYESQKKKLISECISFDEKDRIDLDKHLWRIRSFDDISNLENNQNSI